MEPRVEKTAKAVHFTRIGDCSVLNSLHC